MYKMFASLFYKTVIAIARFKLGLKAKTIYVQGQRIAYLKKPENSPYTLIAIHGLNDSKETWLPFVRELGSNVQTILIDLLGCGQSSKPFDFNYSLSSQARFLEAAIKAILTEEKIIHFSIIGQSMGGALAMLSANSLRPQKLILLAPLSINYHKSELIKQTKAHGDIMRAPFFHVCTKERFMALRDTLFYIKPKIPKITLKHIISQKCAEAKLEEKKILALIDRDNLDLNADLTDIAKNIYTPTLIIWGNKDKVLHYKNGYELQRLMPDSWLEILKECGHMIQSEYPKKSADIVSAFLFTF